jgi:hypothetical protein
MAQEDYVIADQTGVSFLGDLNNTLAAIVSNNSGATQPSVMYAFMWWYDTNVGVLKLRNAANNAWTTPFADKYDKIGGVLTGQASSTAGDFNLVTNTALSDAAASLTAAQLIGGEFTITPSVARIQTLDTAANIISALSGSVDGSNFTFTIVNLAPYDVTIATAAGVTLVGNMIVNDGSATFRVRRLNSSTVSVTRLDNVASSGINLQTAVATTSGTAIDFTGVPAGVNRVNLTIKGVSTNGISNYLVQIGDGAIDTSGYVSTSGTFNAGGTASTSSTSGFVLFTSGSATLNTMNIQITHMGSNVWVASHAGKLSTSNALLGGGDVTLGGVLDRLRFTTINGSDVFDAGSVAVSWEF